MKTRIIEMGALLLIVAFFASLAVSGTPVSKEEKQVPLNIEEIKKKAENPPPYDTIRAPLSSNGRYLFSNPEIVKALGKKGSAPLKSTDIPGDSDASPEDTSSESALSNTNYPVQILANIRFNLEQGNLPQNEESLAVYGSMVVEGANDYRGAYGVLGGMSGYYVSNDDGATVLRDGAIPPLTGVESGTGQAFVAPSAGDPTVDVASDGTFYYGSMFMNGSTGTWAIGLAKAVPADLVDDSLTDEQVWEVTQVRADDSYTQANDKEWIGVDKSGTTYNGYIYMTWTAFNANGSKIWMARCNPSPFSCTVINNDANAVSGTQTDTQMSMVNVDSSGRVVVTWVQYVSSSTAPYYKVNLWYRVYSPGGVTALTSPRLIASINKPASGNDLGNDFRIPPNVWNELTTVNGVPRMYLAYSACSGSYLIDVYYPPYSYGYAYGCSNINSYLKYVDNYHSGSPTTSTSIGLETSSTMHSFFPTLAVNEPAKKLDIAFYQTEPGFKHDLFLATQVRNLSTPTTVTQATSTVNAGDPDGELLFYPFGGFIGDYIQIVTKPGTANKMYVGYNDNLRYSPPFTLAYPGYTLKFGGYSYDNKVYTKTG